jgi:hypothetical protein
MRKLIPVLLAVAFGWATTAWAQSVYDDDDDDAPAPGGQAQAAPAPAPQQSQAAAPQAQQEWRYNGPHAVNAQYGSGWCNVQAPHTHPYPPFDDHLFQENNGGYNFLGDPSDFGYAGDGLTWFNGAHPIATGWGAGWCYIGTPHRHLYRPMGSYYSMCGTYWCYSGAFDAMYWAWRPYWTGYWGGFYPRFYAGGLYFRTGISASPGRWAGYGRPGYGRPGYGNRGYGYGRPGYGNHGGRPGGTYGRPGGTYGRPGGYARPGTSPAVRSMPGRSMSAPHYAAPRTAAPRTMSAPRPSAPRPSFSRPSGGGFRGGGGGGGRHR